MRISDWSSDVCSSDLYFEALQPDPPLFGRSPVEIARIESWTRRIENDGYTAVVYAFRNSRDAFKGRAASGKWPPIPQIPELATRGAIMWNAFVEGLDRKSTRLNSSH